MNRVGFWILLFSALASTGIAAYYFFLEPNGAEVFLEFVKPNEVLVGQPFNLSVSFSNSSDQILQDVKLSLILPGDLAFVGESQEQRVFEKLIGDLGPGSLNQESFDVIVLEGAHSLKRVEAKLTYRLSGSSTTIFESSAKADIAVGRPAVDLSFSLPERVFSGEDFEMSLKYRNNTNQDLKNIWLKVDYPPVFQYKGSNLEAVSGNNLWNIKSLARGEEGDLVISGNVVGPANSLSAFKAEASIDIRGQRYFLANQSANLEISFSPLGLEIMVNGSPEYLAHPGDNLKYDFIYRNNSNVSMENVNIRAIFSGEMFDFTEVRTNASFNSLTNTFVWNAANTPDLLNLPPGGEGKVELYIRTKNTYPIRRLSDKNFSLNVQGEIESRTVPPRTVAERTISVTRLETKIVGMIKVDASAYYRDAASGILNKGNFPPQVNQPTQYTVHWTVRNYANDVTNAKVRAYLQSGTTFTGVVKSNIPRVPVYNPASGEVVWDIGNIPATKGVIDSPLEAIFQIENIPAVNQVGSIITLVGETRITAMDSFSGIELIDTDFALTTDLKDDKTINQSVDRKVQP